MSTTTTTTTTTTHTAIALTAPNKISQITLPTKRPAAGEVRIRVEYAALNPPDVYQAYRGFAVEPGSYPVVLGLTASGRVDEVGEGVGVGVGVGVGGYEIGDRVTSYVFLDLKDRATQEYIVQPTSVVSKIPDSLALHEAAAIPNNFVCAFYTLFSELGLPVPSSFEFPVPEGEGDAPPLADAPILVYGASSSTGVFVVQLLRVAGYRRVIATASSRHHAYLRSLGAVEVFDYRSASLVDDVAAALNGGDHGRGGVVLAVDCISATETVGVVSRIVGKRAKAKAKVAVLLPIKEGGSVVGDEGGQLYYELPKERNPFVGTEVEVVYIRTFTYQKDEYLKDNLMPRILPMLLGAGIIKPPRVRLLERGSFKERVEEGLDLIRRSWVSGEKVVVKVGA